MKRLRNLCIGLALVLSHGMCAAVAFAYRDLLCAGAHEGFSAPPELAFLYAVPFAAALLLLMGLAYAFHRKTKKDV